ncbi:hypothetical protein HDU93_004066, partial [Gonapodya sp. JEL0774]
MPVPLPLAAGHGRLRTEIPLSGGSCSIPECVASYPLKLLRVDPRARTAPAELYTSDRGIDSQIKPSVDTAIVYVLTYGGGVVSGDEVKVE